MWRSEQDPGAPPGGTSASRKATPEIPVQQVGVTAFQHPSCNATPFSTFPTAWVIGTASLPDGPSMSSRSSLNPTSSIVHAPSDLIPNGLLATPQPSTPATQLLKVIVSNRLIIPGQDASYGSANGQLADSPANTSGPAGRQLDSLVLPSPSLLPGGVHSLPTPTSTSSQPLKPSDGYGSRGSPLETASSKDSIPGASTEHSVSVKGSSQGTRPPSSSSNRRTEAAPQQGLPRIGTGSSGGGVMVQSRAVDAFSSSGGASGPQLAAPRISQPPVTGGHHGGYGGAPFQHNHGMQAPAGSNFQVQQHPPTVVAAGAASGTVQPPPTSPVAYTAQPYYMAQVPPGTVVVGVHHATTSSAGSGSGNTSALSSRASVGGSGVSGTSREGSGGSGWRGSRSAGGSGTHSGGAGGGASHGPKQLNPYGAAQQIMHGPMLHEGGTGPYSMPHMPYAVYGMMAPGIVMSQVMTPVVSSPRSMDTHGTLPHQPVHMGPMMMPHGPSMPMGMGIGHPHLHTFPPHGHMGGPHMGMHAHPHMAAHAHGTFSHPHGVHYHGGGVGGYGHVQQPYGHSAGPGMHPSGGPYVGGRGAKATGAAAGVGTVQASCKAPRGGAPVAAGTAGGGEAGSGGASGTAGSNRDSPVAVRARPGGREKTEGKVRSAEQRERKPGNSRAPAMIAHCVAETSSLETHLQDLVRQLTPGEDELAAQQVALSAVQELVETRWPHAKVHLIGSAANGLSIAGSNEIDITIEVPDMAWDDHAAKAAMVSELGELASGVPPASAASPTAALVSQLDTAAAVVVAAEDAAGVPSGAAAATPANEGAAGGATGVVGPAAAEPLAGAEVDAEAAGAQSPRVMTAVSALPKARTPIVKMTVTSTQTRLDVTINNLLAISNTRLLGRYCDIDPRLSQLVRLVKHWARTRSVNDAYRGSLSSYAYVLLCIWLLQQRQPAILPVLQQREPHTYDTTVGPWRCLYNDRIENVKDFGAGNNETLAELLVAFFDHWAWRHDYNGSVVCVRTGGTMPKAAKDWTKRQGNERHLMCIEDPFELSHDLGRTIDKAAVQVLRREFERAARIFASNPDPLPELLAPLTPEEEAAVAAALQSRRKASKDKERAKEKLAAAAVAVAVAAAAGGSVDGAAGGGSGGGADGSMAAAGSEDAVAIGRISQEPDGSDGDDWPGNAQPRGAAPWGASDLAADAEMETEAELACPRSSASGDGAASADIDA